MPTFTGYIQDDRYAVPTLKVFFAGGAAEARRMAVRDLTSNPHHRCFEVRDESDRLLFVAKLPRADGEGGVSNTLQERSEALPLLYSGAERIS